MLKKLLIVITLCLLLINPLSLFSKEKKIIIGAKNFTENIIFSEITRILLEKKGYNIVLKKGVGSTVIRKALETGQVDMYYEYTGTAYTVYYKGSDFDIMRDGSKLYKWVRKNDKKKGLIWLKPLDINNTYTLMMQQKNVKEYNIYNISDLVKYMEGRKKPIKIGIDAEFYGRSDGFKALAEYYNFPQNKYIAKIMDQGLTYLSLKEGLLDVAMGFATDGRIKYYNLVNLEDDKRFFPVYNPACVVRKVVLDKFPDIKIYINKLADKIDLNDIRRLNYLTDIKHKSVESVAKKFFNTLKFNKIKNK
ncbi:MAG: glycine betaine ABC transporter substrate-binding protein [Deferribacterota bacterium]|nr:glycine betaine ABC transporter substrate-binding protein [Deferribacterota bacterium]